MHWFQLVSGESMADIMGIKAVDIQPTSDYNPCHYRYSKCSHLCFYNHLKNISVCACPTEMELAVDGITCHGMFITLEYLYYFCSIYTHT